MTTAVVFETHSTSVDNERGVATGWAHSRLSPTGRLQAASLGHRRGDDGIDLVLCSDLRRASETARIAMSGRGIPILQDWRLRECDYGRSTRMPIAEMHAGRGDHIDLPYPDGESWREAIARIDGCLDDLGGRWSGRRILVIGHVATRWALDVRVRGRSLEELVDEDFSWREGWEYDLD